MLAFLIHRHGAAVQKEMWKDGLYKTHSLGSIFAHELRRTCTAWWFQFENKSVLFVQFELLSFLVGTGLSFQTADEIKRNSLKMAAAIR